MNQDEVNSILYVLAPSVCRIRLSTPPRSKAYLNPSKSDYPLITMGYIAGSLAQQDVIDRAYDTDEPQIVIVEKQAVIDLIRSLDKEYDLSEDIIPELVDSFCGNSYPAVSGFDIKFDGIDDSTLNLTLKRRY